MNKFYLLLSLFLFSSSKSQTYKIKLKNKEFFSKNPHDLVNFIPKKIQLSENDRIEIVGYRHLFVFRNGKFIILGKRRG